MKLGNNAGLTKTRGVVHDLVTQHVIRPDIKKRSRQATE
jgi:hypothetical protein